MGKGNQPSGADNRLLQLQQMREMAASMQKQQAARPAPVKALPARAPVQVDEAAAAAMNGKLKEIAALGDQIKESLSGGNDTPNHPTYHPYVLPQPGRLDAEVTLEPAIAMALQCSHNDGSRHLIKSGLLAASLPTLAQAGLDLAPLFRTALDYLATTSEAVGALAAAELAEALIRHPTRPLVSDREASLTLLDTLSKMGVGHVSDQAMAAAAAAAHVPAAKAKRDDGEDEDNKENENAGEEMMEEEEPPRRPMPPGEQVYRIGLVARVAGVAAVADLMRGASKVEGAARLASTLMALSLDPAAIAALPQLTRSIGAVIAAACYQSDSAAQTIARHMVQKAHGSPAAFVAMVQGGVPLGAGDSGTAVRAAAALLGLREFWRPVGAGPGPSKRARLVQATGTAALFDEVMDVLGDPKALVSEAAAANPDTAGPATADAPDFWLLNGVVRLADSFVRSTFLQGYEGLGDLDGDETESDDMGGPAPIRHEARQSVQRFYEWVKRLERDMMRNHAGSYRGSIRSLRSTATFLFTDLAAVLGDGS